MSDITEILSEEITGIIAASEICPVCGKKMSLKFNEQKLSIYGRHKVSIYEVIGIPEVYRGRIQFCHLDCWDGLPETEKARLNDHDYDALTSRPARRKDET